MRDGALRLRDGTAATTFGVDSGDAVEVRIDDYRAYPAIALKGTLGAAAAYIDGWWNCDDLIGLFQLLTKNGEAMAALDRGLAKWITAASAGSRFFRRNTVAGSRRNIRDHYDLSDSFFALFLDDTMAYSSGIFTRPDATLEDASIEKFDRICRLLSLSPGDRVLEIGAGWGGFAIHAAQRYGCQVTTTTISRNQFEFARRRVRELGLEDRVTVLCQDYRELSGTYDKLVSIEMIEAVGHEFLETFVRKCSTLLRPDGAMALQSITIPDARYETYRRSIDFIQKYVFPGGCIPSLAVLRDAVRNVSDFQIRQVDDFGLHYAATMRCWRERFWRNIDEVRRLGFDQRFIRTWHYYLCYCEAGFLDDQIGVAQMLLTKPGCRLRGTV